MVSMRYLLPVAELACVNAIPDAFVTSVNCTSSETAAAPPPAIARSDKERKRIGLEQHQAFMNQKLSHSDETWSPGRAGQARCLDPVESNRQDTRESHEIGAFESTVCAVHPRMACGDRTAARTFG